MSWRISQITEEHKAQIIEHQSNSDYTSILNIVFENKYTSYNYCCPEDQQFQSYVNALVELWNN